MKMPKCKVCNRQLEWKKVYTSLWFPRKAIKCGECRTNHNITSHRTISLFITIPMLSLGLVLNNLFSFSMTLIVGTSLILFLGILISLFTPYLVKVEDSST